MYNETFADDEETTSTATPTSVITIRTITSNPITTTSNTVTYLQELIEVGLIVIRASLG